ncbi:MAG: SMP-30/gluconolactonase/LRE family protein [Polyangiales bacterium]
MNGYGKVALGALMILTGCGSSSSEPVRVCASDIAVGEVQAFGPATPAFTEGITFDANGNLFVSALYDDPDDDELLSISVQGAAQAVAQAPSLLGLASSENGILAAGVDTGELLLIDPTDGSVEVVAEDLGRPNFVVTTPWGTVLVSDDSQGEDTIDEVTFDGGVSTWVQGVPTPNGMVFSLDGRTLYVASTFQEPGLWRVPVSEGGQAGVPEKWVSFELTTPDGVAIDSEGNVYVALNFNGQVAKVDADGSASIIAEGVDYAASLAFGQGDFDPCSIYVTSLFGTQLWRVGTGVLGTEN